MVDLLNHGKPQRVLTGAMSELLIVYDKGPRYGDAQYNETHAMQLRVDRLRATVMEGRMSYTLAKGVIRKAERRARVHNKRLLRRFSKRAQAYRRHEAAQGPGPCPKDQRVPGLGKLAEDCEEPSSCGVFLGRIGTTPYCFVIVRWVCGDGCLISYGLWHSGERRFEGFGGLFSAVDATTGKITKPGQFDDPRSVVFSPSGERFIAKGKIYGADGKVQHKGLGGWRGGWLAQTVAH